MFGKMADDELSEGSKQVLMQCFGKFDKKKDGILQANELPKALEIAGITATEKQSAELIKLFDKNGDGCLQITELVDNWKVLAQHSVNGDELLEAFKVLDKNKDGYLRNHELKCLLRKLGEKWSEDEIEHILKTLRKYDTNGDGKFSYPEFVQMYIQDAYPFKKPENPDRKDVTQEYEKVTQEGVPDVIPGIGAE